MLAARVPKPMIKTIISRPMVKRVIKIRAGVLPEMLDMLHRYLCPLITDCAGINIGSEDHQLEVIARAREIAAHYNIRSVEEYVVRALMDNKNELAVQIADAANMYNESIVRVKEVLEQLPPIPIRHSL
jgi:hypothetical protein